ncbi:MAG TPA: anhydro-N-acetylmuramic acid kinase [Candidatus Obscuribacterales bacterium]
MTTSIQPLTVIGLNSGTSMDGVDAALFYIEPSGQPPRSEHVPSLKVKMLSCLLHPFEGAFRHNLKQLIASGQTTLETICRLNAALGEIFAAAALELISQSGLPASQIGLIGSHGQTIWHAPERADLWGITTTSTLQLGEPAIIAARTGIPVIGDFRVQDLAFGGQGAPLAAFADAVLFGDSGHPTGVLNIGGIANLTVIDAAGEAIMAFDTGPGNMIADRAAEILFGRPFDAGGELAGRGCIEESWLSELLEHPYFSAVPPKTTGREVFGQAYADRLIAEGKEKGLSDHDIIATLTALTPMSIVESYVRFVEPETRIDRLILGGGGTENKAIRRLLTDFWPQELTLYRHEDFGISTKFKEALLFALLAYTSFYGIPNNVPRCTGASRRTCLGKLCRV